MNIASWDAEWDRYVFQSGYCRASSRRGGALGSRNRARHPFKSESGRRARESALVDISGQSRVEPKEDTELGDLTVDQDFAERSACGWSQTQSLASDGCRTVARGHELKCHKLT